MSQSPFVKTSKTPSIASGKTADTTPRTSSELESFKKIGRLKQFKIDFEQYDIKKKNCDCAGFPCHF